MYKPRQAFLFLLLPLLFLTIFTILPSIGAFILSFTKYNVFQPIEWIGFDNYIKALTSPKFRQAMGNTVYFWILVTPALTIAPIFVAVLINQKVKGVKFFRLIYYFPVLVSVVITAFLWGWMFNLDGIMNFFMGIFGIEKIGWLSDPKWVIPSLAVVTVWQGFGYYSLFYLAGLQSIPEDLYESAELDGANFFQKHIFITIPMLRRIIFFVTVVSTMAAFKELTLMLTMTDGGPLGASTTVVLLVFKEAFENLHMGYASAVSFLLFIVIMIITLVNQKVIDKDPGE